LKIDVVCGLEDIDLTNPAPNYILNIGPLERESGVGST